MLSGGDKSFVIKERAFWQSSANSSKKGLHFDVTCEVKFKTKEK